jgi:hypothetical protein
MQDAIRVEFVPRTVPADDSTIAHRENVMQRMQNLGHIDPADGEVNATETGWSARINGTEFPVLDFSLQKLDDGKVAVSLVAIADSVQAGDPSLSTATPRVPAALPEEKPKRGRWGQPRPDPREGIPGWTPEPSPGEQVAQNAAPIQIHLDPAVDLDPTSAALRREIRRGFHGNAGGALA